MARTSLAACGQLLQAPFNEPSDRNIKGDGPLYRCYESLGMNNPGKNRANALESIEGMNGIFKMNPDTLKAFLMEKFKTRKKLIG